MTRKSVKWYSFCDDKLPTSFPSSDLTSEEHVYDSMYLHLFVLLIRLSTLTRTILFYTIGYYSVSYKRMGCIIIAVQTVGYSTN